MPFDIALSGIRAASSELSITGNNIANASTTGFKTSRAEFGDVYATSVLGAGTNATGAGVEVQDITQQFTQGNITYTESALDLAVNGNGFFILSNDGDTTYTRSGAFGLDDQGFVVANNGARLQGYSADEAGNIESVIGDLTIQTNIIDPNQTTEVNQSFNLDATDEVKPSTGQEFSSIGASVGAASAGTVNNYPSESFLITAPDGSTLTFTSNANDTAADIASAINSVAGLSAEAQTDATLSNFNNVTNDLVVTINNIDLTVNSLSDLETQINQLTNTTLPGVSASLDSTTGALSLNSSVGTDLNISIAGDAGATLDVEGTQGTAVSLVSGGSDTANVGGSLDIVVDDGYIVANDAAANIPPVPGVFTDFGDMNDTDNTLFSDVIVNAFDADDPDTYNSATSTTIYDSFGVSHVMTQFFVKQPYDATDATTSANHWQMHVQIDGRNVGDPDSTAENPTAATTATSDIYFNSNGSLDTSRTDEFLISNWTPYDDDGNITGALGPNVSGVTPIPDPPVSSNFVIDVESSTQFGTTFAVNSISQNGFTSGQLSGLTVGETGVIFARFTNGESLSLGQVLLADFANQQGLQPVGDTAWAETYESGDPTINEPSSASLGAIQSGALEGSNVDLSEQLVALIIAQRNFQASAKTIETADSTTQTIINLR